MENSGTDEAVQLGTDLGKLDFQFNIDTTAISKTLRELGDSLNRLGLSTRGLRFMMSLPETPLNWERIWVPV